MSLEQELQQNRPYVLALGGCTTENVMNFLNDYVDFKFYVRQNLICDMSPPLDVSSFTLEIEEAWRVMDKYAIRFHYNKLTNGDFDAVILECAADHIMNYLKIGESIIPDVRNDTLTQGWGKISFDHIPHIRDADIISPFSHEYWELWKRDFFRLYHETLVPYIRDGKKIIFIRRYLCEKYINEHGISEFDDPTVKARNEDLRKIYDFLGYFKGIDFIDPPRSFLWSSDHALTGGPWEYHPELEFYHYVAEEILRICVGSDVADAFGLEKRAQLLQDRASAVALAAARERQVAEMAEQLDIMRADLSQVEALIARNDALSKEIAALSTRRHAEMLQQAEERFALHSEVARLQAECDVLIEDRNRLVDRIAVLDARYAPVKNVYKFLRLGKIKRKLRALRSRLRG